MAYEVFGTRCLVSVSNAVEDNDDSTVSFRFWVGVSLIAYVFLYKLSSALSKWSFFVVVTNKCLTGCSSFLPLALRFARGTPGRQYH